MYHLKIFNAFVRKEFRHILRDRRTLLILFGMPIVQVLLFGYAVTNEFRGADIVVLDQARDALSTELTRQLSASGHFRLAAVVNNRDEIDAAFRAGRAKLAVVIPPDFNGLLLSGQAFHLQLIADGSDPNAALTLRTYANAIIQDFARRYTRQRPMDARITVSPRMVYNPRLKSVYLFVPGVMALILMIVSAMMTALTLAREKELGTLELLLVSPLPPVLLILGKVSPYVLLSFINAVVILLTGYFVFGVPVRGSLVLLLLLCGLFILTALVLGVFIANRTQSQQAAMLGSLLGLMMPTMLLSGFIFPIESMPRVLQWLSAVIPATYFIDILKAIMLKGSGWSYIWPSAAVLALLSVVFLLLAWKNFKIRLD